MDLYSILQDYRLFPRRSDFCHSVQIGLETFLRNGMGKVSDVLLRLPFLPVLVHIGYKDNSHLVAHTYCHVDYFRKDPGKTGPVKS